MITALGITPNHIKYHPTSENTLRKTVLTFKILTMKFETLGAQRCKANPMDSGITKKKA